MKRCFPTLAKKSKYKENDSKGEENWVGTLNKDSFVIFSPKNLHEKIKLVRRLFRSASTGETTQQRLGKTHMRIPCMGIGKLALNSFPKGHKNLLLEL